MPRPLTRAQTLQNRAFLRALSRTGNAREAARTLGAHRSTFTKRRNKHPGFATAWDAALALAHARLNANAAMPDEGTACTEHPGAEPRIVRLRSGRLQLREPVAGRLTRAHEQQFLAALSATANIRLAAKAAGFSHSAFYRHRDKNPGFAREMRLALQLGYDRLEAALLESFEPGAYQDDAWRHNEPPPIPSMTAAQALQLLYLHQKEARLLGEPEHLKRRRGESSDAHSYRLGVMYQLRQQRDREAFDLAEAERRARGEANLFGPAELPPLPALDQVTGWSDADPAKPPHDRDRALFGGWRLKERED